MAEIKEQKVLLMCLQPSACGMCAGGSLNIVLLIGSSLHSSAQFRQIPMEKSVPLFQKNNGQLISAVRQGKRTLQSSGMVLLRCENGSDWKSCHLSSPPPSSSLLLHLKKQHETKSSVQISENCSQTPNVVLPPTPQVPPPERMSPVPNLPQAFLR